MAGTISPEDLTREKSLLALYWLSRKFPTSRANCFFSGLAALVLLAFFVLGDPDAGSVNQALRKIADIGLSLSSALLGFLIAGFTVFATVTKVELFGRMAKIQYGRTGESYLKYNLSAFVVVFVHYIAFLFCCVVLQVFGQLGGPVSTFMHFAMTLGADAMVMKVHKIVTAAVFCIAGTWLVYLVMLLKSFVYNIYQVLTTLVRWELEIVQRLNSPP